MDLKPGTPVANPETSGFLTVNLADNIDSLSKSLEVFHNENKSPCVFEVSDNSLSEIGVSADDKSESSMPASSESENFIPLDRFEVMDTKLNHLFDMYSNYNKMLSEVKESLANTQKFIETSEERYKKIVYDACNDAVLKFLSDRIEPILDENATAENKKAKLLLEALEMKNRTQSDRMIETSLMELLQSDRLRDQMVSSTVSCLEETIRKSFSNDMSSMYLPILDSANYRLLRRVTNIMYDAVRQIQVKTCLMSKSSAKGYRQLNWSLERHQRLVEEYSSQYYSTNYLKTIGDSVHEALSRKFTDCNIMPRLTNVPVMNSPNSLELSSPTVSSSQFTIFDDIMNSKPSQDITAVTKSFEDALSAEDVSRVVTACKIHDPTFVFTYCRLAQSVLLSLVQQLSTDLLFETPLKLRYMEESIMHLRPKDEITHRFLPTVAKDVLRNLTTFLNKFPHHLHSRRVKMLLFAIESLLKINM